MLVVEKARDEKAEAPAAAEKVKENAVEDQEVPGLNILNILIILNMLYMLNTFNILNTLNILKTPHRR